MDFNYTPLYYATPIQVRYYNDNEQRYVGAIALHNYLIDGHTGELHSLDTIIKRAGARGIHFDDAVIEMAWKDLDESITR